MHKFSTSNIGKKVKFEQEFYDRNYKPYTKEFIETIVSMIFNWRGEGPTYYKLSNGWFLVDAKNKPGCTLPDIDVDTVTFL